MLRAIADTLALVLLGWLYFVTVVPPPGMSEDEMLDRLARSEWAICQATGQPSADADKSGLTCAMLLAEIERISR